MKHSGGNGFALRFTATGFGNALAKISGDVASLGVELQDAYQEAVEEFAERTAQAARRNLGREHWKLSNSIGSRVKFYARTDSGGKTSGRTVGFVGVRGDLDVAKRWSKSRGSLELNRRTGEFRRDRIAAAEYAEPIVYWRFHESGYFRRMEGGRLFERWESRRGVDGEFYARKRFRDVKIRRADRVNSTTGNYVVTKPLRFFERAAPTAEGFVDAIFAINQTLAEKVFKR